MLNPHGAPAVAQFLLQVSYDGLMPFTSFDWGSAEGFPFLPRVQAGRIVLRPAEWNVAKETIGAGSESVERWRRDWDVPQHIALTVGDNRLIIDLDQPVQARQLLAEAGTLRDGQTLLVQEVLPALDEAWLQGPEGHYYGEFVIPLVRCHSIPKERIEGSPAIVAADGGSAPERKPAVERLDSATSTMTRRHPPGSAWMFVKLYCSSHREDALIGGSLQEFADNVIASELADSWFFIRYGDPEAHLRVRFHGQPERLSNQLFGQVCQWARGLMDTDACSRFAFDTYDQEIERFGGPDGMTVAESLFYADSRSATALVKALRTKEWAAADDRSALLAVAIDDLLDALGFDERQRVDWYRRQIDSSAPDVGQRYRELKTVLRAALGDTSAWLVAKPFGAAIESALGQRRSDVAELARTLRRLSTDRRLSQSPESLGASFTHLQLNRVGAAADERALLGLLHRTRAGLLKAPLMSVR
jgi:thiopeptide-type bacteriocin biosynthesis protein